MQIWDKLGIYVEICCHVSTDCIYIAYKEQSILNWRPSAPCALCIGHDEEGAFFYCATKLSALVVLCCTYAHTELVAAKVDCTYIISR